VSSNETERRLAHVALGRANYEETLDLQRRLHARRVAGEIPDVVLTVEHPPVFTLGRSGSRQHVLASAEDLKREGIAIFEVERGGDVTYHGPGQLVVYPILDLRDHGRDVKRYVAALEEAAIRTLADVGIEAGRRPGYPGVWVKARKIASIGVYVRHWVTRHGLALNVAVDRAHFAMINPCGLGVEVASIDEWVEHPVLEEVETRFLAHLGTRLERTIRPAPLEALTGEGR
jgi:lipoate-protein ligase B